MARGIPAYALGGLIILTGFIAALSLILSIPSPLTTVTGYLNITANAYLGFGNNLLVIIGQNNFNFPITRLGIYIPRTGTNITLTGNIASGSYFLLMIYQGPNNTVVIAPGLSVIGDPGNLANLTRSGASYSLNATATVYGVVKSGVFQLTTQDSGVVYALPVITNVSRPILGIYIFQMAPMGSAEVNGFDLVPLGQVVGGVRCNVSGSIPIMPGEPTYFAINMSSTNGTLEPLGIWYACNATPTTSLPSLLYLDLALKYVYTYGNIVIRREDWFPVYIVPMQFSNVSNT